MNTHCLTIKKTNWKEKGCKKHFLLDSGNSIFIFSSILKSGVVKTTNDHSTINPGLQKTIFVQVMGSFLHVKEHASIFRH